MFYVTNYFDNNSAKTFLLINYLAIKCFISLSNFFIEINYDEILVSSLIKIFKKNRKIARIIVLINLV
jgi:hypothetical protein